MNWDLFGIAVLLTLAGLYMLESVILSSPVHDEPHARLKPPRTAFERAWLAEPVQIFMRQLLAARQRRSDFWNLRKNPVQDYSTYEIRR